MPLFILKYSTRPPSPGRTPPLPRLCLLHPCFLELKPTPCAWCPRSKGSSIRIHQRLRSVSTLFAKSMNSRCETKTRQHRCTSTLSRYAPCAGYPGNREPHTLSLRSLVVQTRTTLTSISFNVICQGTSPAAATLARNGTGAVGLRCRSKQFSGQAGGVLADDSDREAGTRESRG